MPQLTVYSPPNSNNGSTVVNGQLVNLPLNSAFNPASFGSVQYSSPPTSPFSTPLSISQLAANQGNTTVSVGNSTLTNVTPSTTNRGSTPLGFFDQPAWFDLLLILFGLCWIRYIHWNYKGDKN